MNKIISLILFYFIQIISIGQEVKELNFTFNVISEETNEKVICPIATVYYESGNIIVIDGDSLGKIDIVDTIVTKTDKLYFEVEAEGRYSKVRSNLKLDTSLSYITIDTTIILRPEIICIDSWSLPNLYFKSNLIELDSASQIVFEDCNIKEWIKYIVIPLNCKVELISYVGYSEFDSIGMERLEFVRVKLNKLGLENEDIICFNKGQNDYYHSRLDGCFPYYLLNKKPLLVNEELVNRIPLEKEYYESLRRVVIVNLVKLK